MNIIYCICGKMCTSKPGITLHRRYCKEAKEAMLAGKSPLKETDIIQPRIKYINMVDEFAKVAEAVAYDAHIALTEDNKSAGRRARTGFIQLRDMIIPIRKKILDKMKK